MKYFIRGCLSAIQGSYTECIEATDLKSAESTARDLAVDFAQSYGYVQFGDCYDSFVFDGEIDYLLGEGITEDDIPNHVAVYDLDYTAERYSPI